MVRSSRVGFWRRKPTTWPTVCRVWWWTPFDNHHNCWIEHRLSRLQLGGSSCLHGWIILILCLILSIPLYTLLITVWHLHFFFHFKFVVILLGKKNWFVASCGWWSMEHPKWNKWFLFMFSQTFHKWKIYIPLLLFHFLPH